MESGLRETLSINGNTFTFELCRHPYEELGPVTIDHWWMPVTELYAQRQHKDRQDANHRHVIDFFWQAVIEQEATDCRPAQERYLLANLLPDVRSQGSRRIFCDAFLRRGSQSARSKDSQELNRLLIAEGELSMEEFRARSRDLIGQTQFPGGSGARRDEITLELLNEGCEQLSRGQQQQALTSVSQAWESLTRKIGRRAGNDEQKIILDVLSYEARAAFHHCYSVVWNHLVPALRHRYGASDSSCFFHSFWHRDWIGQQGESLFHGHVFGLHPGTGPLLTTDRGRRLLGSWISNPESMIELKRLLHGLFVALYHYSNRHDSIALSRRQDSICGLDLNDLPW